jgi:hypothetical protein
MEISIDGEGVKTFVQLSINYTVFSCKKKMFLGGSTGTTGTI